MKKVILYGLLIELILILVCNYRVSAGEICDVTNSALKCELIQKARETLTDKELYDEKDTPQYDVSIAEGWWFDCNSIIGSNDTISNKMERRFLSKYQGFQDYICIDRVIHMGSTWNAPLRRDEANLDIAANLYDDIEVQPAFRILFKPMSADNISSNAYAVYLRTNRSCISYGRLGWGENERRVSEGWWHGEEKEIMESLPKHVVDDLEKYFNMELKYIRYDTHSQRISKGPGVWMAKKEIYIFHPLKSSYYSLRGHLEWHERMYYVKTDGEWFKIGSCFNIDLRGVNKVLEAYPVENMSVAFKPRYGLFYFLCDTYFASHISGDIMDERYFDITSSSSFLKRTEKSPEAFRRLCYKPIIKYAGNKFETKFNLLTNGEGAVLKMSIHGEIIDNKIRIIKIEHTWIRVPGTFSPPEIIGS